MQELRPPCRRRSCAILTDHRPGRPPNDSISTQGRSRIDDRARPDGGDRGRHAERLRLARAACSIWPASTSRALPPAIAATRRLLEASRRAGVKVIYLQMSYRPDLSDAGDASSPNYHKELGIRMMRQRPELQRQASGRRQLGLADRRSADSRSRATMSSANRATAASAAPIWKRICGPADIRYLLFTGVATNVCVESTARDAYLRGILADPGRGRDEPFGSRLQPPGDAVEFRARLRLGDAGG